MTEPRIKITADAAQAIATMRRLGDAVGELSGGLLGLKGLAGGLGGALSIGAFAAFIKNTVDGIDALNDLHDATGASIEMLSGLEDVAARTGTSMDTVGGALVKFNKALEEAKPGSSAELALKAIGLNAEELKKIDPAEALRQTAVALSGFADDGNKARLVQELFGKSVREVAPLLKDLAEGGALVAKVTTEQAAQAEAFNKQLAELKKNITDVSRSLVSDLVTGLNAAAKAFKEGGLIEGLQTLMTGDDQFKNNKSLVENTDKLLRLENALLAARAQGYAENSRNIQNLKAQLQETKAALGTNMAYAKVQENGPTGTPAAPEAPKASLGPMADPAALKAAQAEADKLRQQEIQGWAKYADAVLAEGERIEEIQRQQIEKANQAEQGRLDAVKAALAKGNQALAESLGLGEQLQAASMARRRAAELEALDQRQRNAAAGGQLTLADQEAFNVQRLQIEQRYATRARAEQAAAMDLLSVDSITRQRAASLAALDEQKRAAQAAGQWSAQAETDMARQRLEIRAAADVQLLTMGAQTMAQVMENAKRSQTQRIIAERDADLAALEQRRQDLQAANQWSLELETEYEEARLLINAKAGAAVAQRLETLNAVNLSEADLQRNHFAQLQADLEAARNAGLITEQQYNQLLEQETLKHKAKMGDISAQAAIALAAFEKKTTRDKVGYILSQSVQLTQGIATSNKELFEINKIAGIAQASIALYEGTSKTWNAYPYPWNIPMTALHVATGLAQIQAISSAQFGSSTSAPTIGGGGAIPVFNAAGAASPVAPLPAPNAQIEPPEQLLSITFAGSGRYTQEEIVDGLLPALEAAWANGAGRTRMNVTYS